MSAIQQAICSINNFLMEFKTAWGKEFREVTASLKRVSMQAAEQPQDIVRRNPKRSEVWVHNAGDQDLFLALYPGDIKTGLFSIRIKPGDTIIISSRNFAHLYKNVIQGYWDNGASTDSYANVTEFTID